MMEYISDEKQRLDKFLASRIEVSRGRIQAAIKNGEVKVNGKPATETDYRLSAGDKVTLPEFEDQSLKPLDADLNIVYENDHLAVLDKPANLVVHPGAGHTQDTLSNILLAKYPEMAKVGEPHRPGIVHRLDEDTSGLMIVAKTPAAYEYLKQQFLEHRVHKQYLALVHGIPEKLHGVIDLPIGRSSTHQKMKVGVGRDALTEYSVVAVSPEKPGLDQMALLRVKLHTGRTHQIRTHLAHIGHPIVGDQTYGGFFKLPDQALLNRQFLHAARLQFDLADGTHLELESPLPPELTAILDQIGIDHN